MNFIVIGNREWFKSEGKNVTYLKIDYWDDYDFCTQFSVKLFDDKGVGVELGDVKIGYQGQPKDTDFPTYKKLDQHFQGLDDSFSHSVKVLNIIKSLMMFLNSVEKNIWKHLMI